MWWPAEPQICPLHCEMTKKGVLRDAEQGVLRDDKEKECI
jgi:hypothetical protein